MRNIKDYRKHDIKWRGTDVCRLRLVSFVAERFWSIAFKDRAGLNILTWESVKFVILSDVIIDGRKYCEASFDVLEKDAVLALKIARGAVEVLQNLRYRILDAIVPEVGGGEHDIIGERDGLRSRSSIEIKCRQINKPEVLLPTVRKQLREDALKLWRPEMFSERMVLLIEFGAGSLDSGWREIRCEAYNGLWKSLRKWEGEDVPVSVESNGCSVVGKRKRESSSNRSSARNTTSNTRGSNARGSTASSNNFVLIAGSKHTTLPMYLGRTPVKSEKQLASASASWDQVDLRHGTWATLERYKGQEILDQAHFDGFRSHRWVSTLCSQNDSRGHCLQVRLVARGHSAASSKFLWSVSELQKCPWRS